MDAGDTLASRARRMCDEVNSAERRKKQAEEDRRRNNRLRAESVLQMVRAECRLHRKMETEGLDLPSGSYVNVAEYLERDNLPEYLRRAILSSERKKNMSATSIELFENELSTNGSFLSSSYLPSGDNRREGELRARLKLVFEDCGRPQGGEAFIKALDKAGSIIEANKLGHLVKHNAPIGNRKDIADCVATLPEEVTVDDFVALFAHDEKEETSLLMESSAYADIPARDSSVNDAAASNGCRRPPPCVAKPSRVDFTRHGFGVVWQRVPRTYRGLGIDHLSKLRREAMRNKDLFKVAEIDLQSGIVYARLGRKAALKVFRRCIRNAETQTVSSRKEKQQSSGEASASRDTLRDFRRVLDMAYKACADVCLGTAFNSKADVHDPMYKEGAANIQKYAENCPKQKNRRSRKIECCRVLETLRERTGCRHMTDSAKIILDASLGPCLDLLIQFLTDILSNVDSLPRHRASSMLKLLGELHVERHEFKKAREIFERHANLVGEDNGAIAPIKISNRVFTLGDRINTLAKVSGAVHARGNFARGLPPSTKWRDEWPERYGECYMDKRKEWAPLVDTGEAFAGDQNPSPRTTMRMLLMHPSNKPVTPPSSAELDAKRMLKPFKGMSGTFFPSSSELLYSGMNEKLWREELSWSIDRPKTPRRDVRLGTNNPSITQLEIKKANKQREQIAMFDAEVESRMYARYNLFEGERNEADERNRTIPIYSYPIHAPPQEWLDTIARADGCRDSVFPARGDFRSVREVAMEKKRNLMTSGDRKPKPFDPVLLHSLLTESKWERKTGIHEVPWNQ